MPNHARRNTTYRWLLLAILLFAFALRLFRLGAESLWYDETVSVYLAGQSLPALIAHTAGDIHPPGYYLLLHAWTRLAGSSDWAVAFPSLFFGLLLVALAYWLGAHLFGPRAGLLAAFLVAISPYNLWYSQEVRMYTLGAVLGMGLLAATLSLLDDQPSRRFETSGRVAAYAVLGALGLWVLYYFAFLLVAVNVMVGLWWLLRRRQGRAGGRWLGQWALAQGAVLLLYVPWLPVAWRQATSPPVPPWRSFAGLGDVLLQTWSALSLGQSADPAKVWPVLLLFAALFGLGLFLRPDRFEGWLLVGYVFGPVLLIYLASFVTPLYHVRYAFTYSTPFYAVLGAGLAWLWRRWRPAVGLGLALIVAFSGLSVYNYHFDPRYASDDHRTAVHYLAEHWRPGDAILVDAGYAYTALLTYWDGEPIAWRGRLVGDASGSPPAVESDRGPVVVQAGAVDGDPSLGWGDPASDFYAMSRQDTAAALERLFAGSYRVWIYRIYDTVTDPGGFVRDWLSEHSTKFEDQVFTGESQLRVQGYLGGCQPLPGGTPAPGAELADGSLRLLASDLRSEAVPVGGTLDLAPVWQVAVPLREDAILFAGLFDESEQRWAQTDERPLGSLYPVTAWPAGAVVRTPLRVSVPAGTPPGRYQLEMGWYRFVDGQPIWLPWQAGDLFVDGQPRWPPSQGGNLLALGEVEVTAPGDWWQLPAPQVPLSAGVTMGSGVRFLGFDAPRLEGQAGDALPIDLFWRALDDAPGAGLAVLQISKDDGTLLAEFAAAPAGGRAQFVGLSAGQVVRDPRAVPLPEGLAPGVYNLSLGRRQADGHWLAVRRGFWTLGEIYPLATIRVLAPGQ
jgi:mannosyltransferase